MNKRANKSRSVAKSSKKQIYSCCLYNTTLYPTEINLDDSKNDKIIKKQIWLKNNGIQNLPPLFKLVNSPDNQIRFRDKLVNNYREIPPSGNFYVDLEFIIPLYIQPDNYIVIGKIQIDELGEFEGFSYCIDVKKTKKNNNDYQYTGYQNQKKRNNFGHNNNNGTYSNQWGSSQFQNQNDNSFRKSYNQHYNNNERFNLRKQNNQNNYKNYDINKRHNFNQEVNKRNWNINKEQSFLNSSGIKDFDYPKNITNENEEQKNIINTLKEENNNLIKQNEKLQSEKTKIEQEYNDLKYKYNQDKANEISNDKFNNLLNEKIIIESKLNKSEQENNNLLNEIKRLKEIVTQQKNKIELLLKEKEYLNNLIQQQNVNQVPSDENEIKSYEQQMINNNNFDENLQNNYKENENYQRYNIKEAVSQPVNPTQIHNINQIGDYDGPRTELSVELNVPRTVLSVDLKNENNTNDKMEFNDNIKSGITPSGIETHTTKTEGEKQFSSNIEKKLTEEDINNIINDLERRYNVTSIFSMEDIRNAIIEGKGDDDKIQEILFE